MTKETKIGLLVGLTFIFLFAIILSEKGATNNSAQPSNLTIVDGARPGSAAMPRANRPLDGVGNVPIETTIPPAIDTRTIASTGAPVLQERPVGIPFPSSEDEILPLPESVVSRLNVAPMGEREVEVADVGPMPDTTIPLFDAVAKAVSEPPSENSRLSITRDSDEPMIRTVSNDDRGGQRESPAAAPKPKIIARHEVQSGESLGKVAARYYGRATPSRINAIFDVNRDKLTSIHAVRVGETLRIPALPDADGIAFVDATDFRGASIPAAQRGRDSDLRIPIPINQDPPSENNASTASREKPVEFAWYEVKENDTLSRIAQRELGNNRLYLKLYELNRDILPNKNTIKPGMKIRLPVVRAGDRVSSADFPRSRRDGN